MSEGPQSKPIQSVEKALQIIELLMEDGDHRLSAIAREMDAPKSTVHYHLETLRQHRYVVKRDGTYSLGLRFLTVGGCALIRHQLIRLLGEEVVTRHIDELAERTGETAVLAVMEAGRAIFLYQARANDQADMTVNVGTECHLHSTAVGKAMLAALPEEAAETVIDRQELSELTNRTFSSKSEILEELTRIREDRLAYEDGEWIRNQRSIATPVVDKNEESVLGSVGVIGPADRIERPERRDKARRFSSDISKIVQQTGKILEDKILLQAE